MYWEKGQCESVSETRSWAAGLDHVTQEFSTKRQESWDVQPPSLYHLWLPALNQGKISGRALV